jgi:asparagine synthase (glutamine-hydrolysing)
MSGIAALFHLAGRPVEPEQVRRMLDAVSYLGPDGSEVYTQGVVGLGCAQMRVTLEEGRQPLVSSRSGCVIVADVRLDNRRELLDALPSELPAGASDADILLLAYEHWGTEAPARLLGDFAFVLWDPRRRQMVCARDTSGERPLYYREAGGVFAASSEIHQLFQDPAVPITPDEDHIRSFLTPLNLLRNEKDWGSTFYSGIRSLPPAHLLVVDAGGLRLTKYWELTPRELRYRRNEEYEEHFRAVFSEAVGARLRSAGPVGAMLSGGLDSSSVVCVAQELFQEGKARDQGFRSYSLDYAGLECGERPLIESIQAKYGFPAQFFRPQGEFFGWLRLAPEGFQPSPLARTSESDLLFQAAARAGVRVLLTGDVADACVRGSWWVFDSLLRQGRLRDFGRYLRRFRRTFPNSSISGVATQMCLLPLLPASVQGHAARRTIRRYFDRGPESRLPEWMPPALGAEVTRRYRDLALEEVGQKRFASPAREQEYRQLSPPEVPRRAVGWPVELRRPYADRRLQEFLLAVPPEQKFEPHPESDELYAASKQIVRRSLRGILPDVIRERTAPTHFASAFEDELSRHWPLYEEAFGPGKASRIAERGYVEPARFWERLSKMRGGERGEDLIFVMRMAALETWLRALELPRPGLTTPDRGHHASTATDRDARKLLNGLTAASLAT